MDLRASIALTDLCSARLVVIWRYLNHFDANDAILFPVDGSPLIIYPIKDG
jgi:hypothetical protein